MFGSITWRHTGSLSSRNGWISRLVSGSVADSSATGLLEEKRNILRFGFHTRA